MNASFDEQFWDLWYAGQTEEEKNTPWLPEKRPLQVPEELLECLKVCSTVENPRVVEIGSWDGRQKVFWETLINAQHVGVDNDFNRKDSDIIYGESANPETVEAVIEAFGGKKPNIVFIDGDHRYSGVLKDWEVWMDVVERPGIVCIHDIKLEPGPLKLWLDLCEDSQLNLSEIFHEVDYVLPKLPSGRNRRLGIGIIHLNVGDSTE